jgi:endonuclease-3
MGISPTTDEIAEVATRLALAYPYIAARKAAEGVLGDDPLSGLVRAILSQNTTDVNRDRAFETLRSSFPSWDAVADAPLEDVIAAIRQSIHAPTKALRIQDILCTLRMEHGTPTLDFLRAWPTDRVLAYLRGFTGVGAKSAAIVALFTLGRPVMPVDTHVYRVTQRLGWVGPHTSAERAHDVLQALVPPELVFPLHTGLWEHGRRTCRPVPRCTQCSIYAFCIYPAKTATEPPLETAIALTAGDA